MFPSGQLVVAKQKGYPPWPSIVAPASNGTTQKIAKRIHFTHVVFLEYLNQHAWVPTKDIKAFTSSEEFKESGFGVRAAADTAARMSSMSEEQKFASLNSGSSGISTEDSALKTTRRLKRNAGQGTSIGQTKNGNKDDELVTNAKRNGKKNENSRKARRVEEESNDNQENSTNGNKDDELVPNSKRNDKKNEKSRKARRFEEESNDDQENSTNGNKDDELVPNAKKTAKRNDKLKVGTNENKKKTSGNEKENALVMNQAMGGCHCCDKIELSIEKISVKMSTQQFIQVTKEIPQVDPKLQ